jgi:CrcB protein
MVTGDTLFYDFPANVVGSFFIGLLSTGTNLATIHSRHCDGHDLSKLQLLFLPASSSLQRHGELHLGLRTGYCGSLTTFSSWFLQARSKKHHLVHTLKRERA